MRGKAAIRFRPPGGLGITPAYAGKSEGTKVGLRFGQDHPRICGEKSIRILRMWERTGSPPHMRGKEQGAGGRMAAHGITPAYAGKREGKSSTDHTHEDHPRICGEKNRRKLLKAYCDRITPAYAGKSTPKAGNPCIFRDHPRICGEKRFEARVGEQDSGSPPHMRGKELCKWAMQNDIRITPAYAGKSSGGAFPRMQAEDHPRICGEKTKKIP